MKTTLSFIVIFFQFLICLGQSYNIDHNEMLELIGSKKLCKSVKGLTELAAHNKFILDQPSTADSLLEIAINKTEESNDKQLMIESYIAFAKYCSPKNYTEAETYLKKALSLEEKLGSANLKFQILIQIGNLYRAQSKIDEGIKAIMSSREYVNNDFKKEFEYYLALANLHYETTDVEVCLENYNLALEYATRSDDDLLILEAYEKLIKFCIKNQMYSYASKSLLDVKDFMNGNKKFNPYDHLYVKSLELLHLSNTQPNSVLQKGTELIKEARSHGFIALENTVYGILRLSLMNNGDVKSLCDLYCSNEHKAKLLELKISQPDLFYRIQAFICENNKDKDSAEIYWNYAEEVLQNQPSPAYRCNFYIRKGQYYARNNQLSKALESYKKANEYSLRANYIPMVIESSALLDSIYFLNGDIPHAYEALKQNKKMMDSSSNKLLLERLNSIQNNASQKFSIILAEKEEKKSERIYQYQLYFIGLFIVLLLYTLVFISKKSVSLPTIKLFGYITFLFFFEFIIFILHNFLHGLTHSPIILLLFHVIIIAIILPIHHATEHRVIHFLIQKNRIQKESFGVLSIFRNWINKYKAWLHVKEE